VILFFFCPVYLLDLLKKGCIIAKISCAVPVDMKMSASMNRTIKEYMDCVVFLWGNVNKRLPARNNGYFLLRGPARAKYKGV
jgi:hypothetical protein